MHKGMGSFMTKTTSICVRYMNAEGWHVFQSDELPGLMVANKDARVAFDDVGPSIKLLLELDEGINCNVHQEMSFEEFLNVARGKLVASGPEEDRPLILSDKRFMVVPLAA